MNAIKFERLSQRHYKLVQFWFNQAHVQKYYSLRVWSLDDVEQKLSKYISVDSDVKAYIMVIDSVAIGYIQSYPVKNHPWPNQNLADDIINNAAGIDFFIGDSNYLGKRYSDIIIINFLKNYIWPFWQYCIADPDINNARSIRLLEKLKFSKSQIIETNNALGTPVRLQLMVCKTDKPEITLALVTELIAKQFPQWAHLPIKPIELSGIDNRTFRLGNDMSIRLPSAQGYAAQVQKEQKWLPILTPYLSFTIPKPLAMGQPSEAYPWNWSVYRWLEGESASNTLIDDAQLQLIAQDLAKFLNELHNIDITDGPMPGQHNYWRGAHPSVYDTESRLNINKLQDIIDTDRAMAVWDAAISSKWDREPVWIHGDFASSNILVKSGRMAAIIDFGCMGMGDPACDLVIAWTFLENKSRKNFKQCIELDHDTWVRARGWALWKASFELVAIKDKLSPEAIKRQKIINAILNEDENFL